MLSALGLRNNGDFELTGQYNLPFHPLGYMVAKEPELVYIAPAKALVVGLDTQISVLDNVILEVLERHEVGRDGDYFLGMDALTNFEHFLNIPVYITADWVGYKNGFH